MFFDKYYNDKGFYDFYPEGKTDACCEAIDFITSHPRETWQGWLGKLCDELLTARGNLWPWTLYSDEDKGIPYDEDMADEYYEANIPRLKLDCFLLNFVEEAFYLLGIQLPKNFFEFHPEANFLKMESLNIYQEDTEGETPIIKETAKTLQTKTTDEDFAKLTKWMPGKKLPKLDRVCVFLINKGVIPDWTTGDYLLKCVLHAHYKNLYEESKKAKFICFIAYIGKTYFNHDYEKKACKDMGIKFKRLRERKIPDFESELSQLV